MAAATIAKNAGRNFARAANFWLCWRQATAGLIIGGAANRGDVMNLKSNSRALGVALILCGCFAGVALAQNAPAAGQEPPPTADEGTTSQLKCIADSSGFKRSGNTATYTIELENKCEQRLKCRVYAYITSSKGPVQGNATLVLAPKSKGAAAKNSYAIKVKMLGGMAQSSRECRVF